MVKERTVRRLFHKFSKMFSVEKMFRKVVASDEAVVKLHGPRAYV